jgi:hypothetical protein
LPDTAQRHAVNGLYIHYGCGLCAPDGWLNFDASPRLKLERVFGLRKLIEVSVGLLFPANVRPGDIVQGLPVAEGTASGVYCSHVLEHLPRDDVPRALGNTLRMLRIGGLFRLVLPDLQWRAAQYAKAAERGDPAAADALIEACLLGTRKAPRGLVSRIRSQFGKNAHLWMYDFAAIKMLLERAGFAAIRRCQIGDSRDPMFALVEEVDRFLVGGEPELAIEAVRPGSSAVGQCGRSDRAASKFRDDDVSPA